MSLWGLLINNGLKTIKAVVRVLNESIVRFSGLQELIEDFQMNVEDDSSTNYDTTKKPYNRISMMRYNSYQYKFIKCILEDLLEILLIV